MFYMGLQVNVTVHPLTDAQIEANNSIRPWDASAANFVLISSKIGMHPQRIAEILQGYRYACNLEMVEQTITAAGMMAWSPS